MIRLLIGGSPCTFWSIAQKKNRETKASGMGWELFKNYLIALEKYKPDYFLYENNKSMSAAIREQITEELGVEPVLINSALLSAQSRKRLYWIGKRNQDGTYSRVYVEQPEDRGVLLRDILESGVCWTEKGYTMAEVVNSEGSQDNGKTQKDPVRVGTIESGTKTTHDSKPFRVYGADGKAVTIQGEAGGYGAKTGLYATPITEPIRVCSINGGGQGNRIYSAEGKSCAIKAEGGGLGGNGQGLYAVPAGMACRGRGDSVSFEMRNDQKSNAVIVGHQSRLVIEAANGEIKPVYEVKGGKITIRGKQYQIKLADGFYIIRKLTVPECMRLQTVPEWYIFPVSPTKAYKMLGNGWTVDVIAHIMAHFSGIDTEPVEVLSMYDGMSCGHIALDKLGATITRYYATEIDKYAIQTTMANYPDTIQLGDAFQVRADDWILPRVQEGQQWHIS